jgi:mRNA-degrading endonuclease RelE of RelBE toxin-antitoxin system
MNILQTPTFERIVKKLKSNQKADLKQAIQVIITQPLIGEEKAGDLKGVRVYKFKMVKQLTLIAYLYEQDIITLTFLSLCSHENFYRDLKHNF